MRIDCPCCGQRDSGEFAYLGDATKVRPTDPAATVEEMLDYVYMRENVAGPHRELWYHTAGCRSWLVAVRDTKTHAIAVVFFARDVARQMQAERSRHDRCA